MPGRVVVITGSAGGIGAVTATRFTAQGDTVIGLDLVDGFDVTVRTDCDAAAAEALAVHGRIDVLCNVAGVGAVGDVVAAEEEDWQRVFGVNVFGVANMSPRGAAGDARPPAVVRSSTPAPSPPRSASSTAPSTRRRRERCSR